MQEPSDNEIWHEWKNIFLVISRSVREKLQTTAEDEQTNPKMYIRL